MKKTQYFIDRLLNNFFNKGTSSRSIGEKITEHYARFPSFRIGGLHQDGTFEIGGYFDVIYEFNEKGEIISRKRLKDIFKEKGQLIFGKREVSRAYFDNSRKNFFKKISQISFSVG